MQGPANHSRDSSDFSTDPSCLSVISQASPPWGQAQIRGSDLPSVSPFFISGLVELLKLSGDHSPSSVKGHLSQPRLARIQGFPGETGGGAQENPAEVSWLPGSLCSRPSRNPVCSRHGVKPRGMSWVEEQGQHWQRSHPRPWG